MEELTTMLHSQDFVVEAITAFKWADADGNGTLDVYEFCPAARECLLHWLSAGMSHVGLSLHLYTVYRYTFARLVSA
jgi:hypothetical protein